MSSLLALVGKTGEIRNKETDNKTRKKAKEREIRREKIKQGECCLTTLSLKEIISVPETICRIRNLILCHFTSVSHVGSCWRDLFDVVSMV